MTELAVLHPGAMGVSVAAALLAGGHGVRWCTAGRSTATVERADAAGLTPCPDLAATLDGVDVAVSVCPPDAAAAQAGEVARSGFAGTYVDANAVAPATAGEIGDTVAAAGCSYVDGGIVGPPAWREGTTRLHLSGERAPEVAALFAAGPLETVVLDGGIGAASALKMCFAASSKAVSAVLIAAAAAAAGHGVLDDLMAEWARRSPDTSERLVTAVRGSAPKAWRFSGEMAEMAATFAAVGVPSGAPEAAEDLYARLAPFKDGAIEAGVDEVLRAVLDAGRAER